MQNYETCRFVAESNFDLDVIKIFPKGTWSETTLLKFDFSSDGALHISEEGESSAVAGKEKVTFIKMDVEDEDYDRVTYFIKSLIPEYRPYIRHHSNGEGEIVLYAMP